MLKIRQNALTKIFDVFKIDTDQKNFNQFLINWEWHHNNKIAFPFKTLKQDIKYVWTLKRNLISKIVLTWTIIKPLFKTKITWSNDKDEVFYFKPLTLRNGVVWLENPVQGIYQRWITVEKFLWEKHFDVSNECQKWSDYHECWIDIDLDEYEEAVKGIFREYHDIDSNLQLPISKRQLEEQIQCLK